jgi:GxxExxY protein
MEINDLTHQVIGCAIEVHRVLGPGLLENAYEEALVWELTNHGLQVQRQVPISVDYKSLTLDCSYRIDLLVQNRLILELKSVEKLMPIHEAQILTYMRLAGKTTGLVLNFNTRILTKGIKRFLL